jgi:FtsP/CotA-like multicopper oxidase with cupredoxin domain
MPSALQRRQVLVLGASCATAAALRTLAPSLSRAAETGVAPATKASEEVLHVAKREAQPAGQRMQALVANDSFPSAPIFAREGDRLRVTVENANDAPTAIHFHGLLVPNGMDGVAGVTQPPIEPRGTFVYELPLGEAGTFLYESTWKTQRQIGLAGAVVVAEKAPRHEVAQDELVLLSDWMNDDPADVVRVLRGGKPAAPTVPPPSNPHAGHQGHGAHGGNEAVAEPPLAPNARAAHQAAIAALPSAGALPAASPGTAAPSAASGHEGHAGHAGHDAPAADPHAGHAGHDAPAVPPGDAPAMPSGPHAQHILEAQKQAAAGGPPAQTYTGEPPRPVNPLPDGAPFPVDVRYNTFLLNGRSHRDAWTKPVELGKRVRLRLVNASAATFFRVQVEGLPLTVIAADGRDVEPVEVDDLVLAMGERYDVVVTLAEPGSYTVRASAVGGSGGAVGVLHTPEARPVISTRPPKWGGRSLAYGQLRAVADTAFGVAAAERVRVVLDGDVARYLWTIDGQSFPGEFVGDAPASRAPIALGLGIVAVLEIENRTTFWQSVHLHGYRFRLLTSAQPDPRAPWKDTVAVPPSATVKLEIRTDAPGRWLLTSTHLYRAQSGLARLIAVG